MRDVSEVAALGRSEQLSRVAPVHLARRLEERRSGGKQPRHRDARIVYALLAAYEIPCDERTIGPWQHVIVQCVDLAERCAQLADLRKKFPGKRCQREIPLLELDTFLSKRHK